MFEAENTELSQGSEGLKGSSEGVAFQYEGRDSVLDAGDAGKRAGVRGCGVPV